MELRTPTPEQFRAAYRTEMRAAFPPAELKPLRIIEKMWRDGHYRPYCLYEGEELLGVCFLWLGHPGWGLLDYLCITERARNRGLGTQVLRLLQEKEPDMVIFGEAEAPEDAPDPAMAKRRLGFYARCGVRVAGYDSKIFGVHYRTLYLADRELSDAELMEEHRYVYETGLPKLLFRGNVCIPYEADVNPKAKEGKP